MRGTAEKIVLVAMMVAVTIWGNRYGSVRSDTRFRLAAQEFTNLTGEPSLARPPADPPRFILQAPPPVVIPQILPPKPEATKAVEVSAPMLSAALPEIPPAALPLPTFAPPPPPPLPPQILPPPPASPPALLVPQESITSSMFHPLAAVKNPALNAQSALIADLLTGEAYFSFAADRRWPIASITKLMTATIATQILNPNETLTLTPNDIPPEEIGSAKPLQSGETYSIGDLMNAMLTISSNQAAEAIANRRGRENFLRRMNAQAETWALHDTHFSDPTGLSPASQSTANDLIALAKNIYQHYPDIFEITRRSQVVVTELGAKKNQTLKNINEFSGEAWFVGGKTGYTDDANGNLLTVFMYSGRPVVTVVLGTGDRFGETRKLIGWFESNYRLAKP